MVSTVATILSVGHSWGPGEITSGGDGQLLVRHASSTGRCNTIQCIDSTMLPRENHLFGPTRPKPSQGSVLDGLTLVSDFSFWFQCQGGSSLVLRRPIETAALTTHVDMTRQLPAMRGVLTSGSEST